MSEPQHADAAQPAEKTSLENTDPPTDTTGGDQADASSASQEEEAADGRSLLFSTDDISDPHSKADLAQEILALRKSLKENKESPGKVRQMVTDLAAKETADDDMDLINTIMSKLSMGEDGEGDAPTREDLLNIYLGFAAEREIELNVKIEGEFNVTVLL